MTGPKTRAGRFDDGRVPITGKTNLRREVSQFQASILRKSLSQLTTSFGGFFATCAAMSAVMDVSYWIALALAPLAAGFLVRIFIIQHDCGHLAFFRSRRANDIVGFARTLVRDAIGEI